MLEKHKVILPWANLIVKLVHEGRRSDRVVSPLDWEEISIVDSDPLRGNLWISVHNM